MSFNYPPYDYVPFVEKVACCPFCESGISPLYPVNENETDTENPLLCCEVCGNVTWHKVIDRCRIRDGVVKN